MASKRVISGIFFMISATQCYKPVIFMHGMLSNSSIETKNIFDWLDQRHPGTKKLSVTLFENEDSLENMNKQVKKIKVEMVSFMKQHPGGVHMLCYSQGGLVCRGVLEQTKHNVDTFVSLSSPQAGQFGGNYIFYLSPG